ncbi:hypothetical protein GCM10023226_20820 [Nocardioides nanhaiensis]|uniref:WD40 repeat domain-containing protein n=1 Tax=Nocardioides nanhaiensis TaxID=1476871 RepID=A0ABP8W7D5_9ACTN
MLAALGAALVVSSPAAVGAVGAVGAVADEQEHRVLFRWQDPDIVESSGLAVVDGLFVTVNDSGDSGRTFVVDPDTGRTVGGSSWAETPIDVEAVAPMPDGRVLVGDIGGNNEPRTSVRVLPTPVQRDFLSVDPDWTDLRYPRGAGPFDAEVLMVHPVSGRVVVVTKSFLGGTVYQAPPELPARGEAPLRQVGTLPGFLTDGAFFPDGQHVVVRTYVGAAVYTWPGLREVGQLRLPSQEQGEAIAVAPDGRVFVSTEGAGSAVHRVAVPPELAAVVTPPAAPSPSPSPSATGATPRDVPPEAEAEPEAEPEQSPVEEVTRRPEWTWWAGGVVGIGILVLLIRSLRPR